LFFNPKEDNDSELITKANAMNDIRTSLTKPNQPGTGWYHAGEAIQALKGPFQMSKRYK
jgi:hypothetical protein